MAVKILIEDCVGQTRAAAFHEDGRPFSLFLDMWHERDRRAEFRNTYSGRITKHVPKQGGSFAELEHGEAVFLRSAQQTTLTEGAECWIKIESEARRGKLARGIVVEQSVAPKSSLDRWRQSLPTGEDHVVEQRMPGDPEIVAAFDEAFQDRITLAGGGVIHLSETPALVAVDVDTAGRQDAGRAYDRALAVNKIAAEETARQLCLRGLGGLAVIDCVAPLRRETSETVRRTFLDAFSIYSSRRVEALKPSPFGLLEISSAWTFQPISHALLDDKSAAPPIIEVLAQLRNLERQLVEHRAATFKMSVPVQAHAIWDGPFSNYPKMLAERYGARFEVLRADGHEWEVSRV